MKRLFLLLATSLTGLTAQATDTDRPLAIWFDTPTTLQGRAPWQNPQPDHAWEERSLPIGNGSLGANILGSIEAERITFNEKTLWLGGPNTALGADYYWNVNKPSAHLLKDIRQAFADGDNERAARLTRENFNSEVSYDSSREEPFRFGHFTTFGEFYIETGLSAIGIADYRRSLSLDSAMATVQFTKEEVTYKRDFFVSYPANVLAVRFTASQPGRQHLTLSYAPNPLSRGEVRPDGSDGLCFAAVLDNNGMRHTLRIRAVTQGGTLSNTGGKLRIVGADEAVFYITADTDYRINFDPDFADPRTYVGTDPERTTRHWIDAAVARGYHALRREHRKDHADLFGRVRLHLNPGTPTADLPTDRRLQRYRQGQPDYYLEELYYQYGRYLLIASSRPGNLPAHLQGIWHNDVHGPWNVDYHNNINLQMNYWHACSTHLEECMLPLIDFIRMLVKPGQETARAYFGARGWTASISANIFGFTTPLESQDMSWNFNPMAGPWLATHIWEYYEYTQDKEFLRQTGYELIKSSARFAVDYLWHKPDGSYTAAPSTSPEHGPVDQGATFVHAVVREILLDAIAAARTLGIDRQEQQEWQQVLEHLAPYRIGRYGQLMEWSADIDDPTSQHRHVNHLFGLHPGRTISPIVTPQWADAARVVLQHRGDGATGWSMGWKLNQWARLHDGNHAYLLFGNLLKHGTLDNLWDTHPPFQIDGNFGGTAGITEMLLQSHMGFLHLLPALPHAWATGCIEGIRAKGNFHVSLQWAEGELTEATIRSLSGRQCTLHYRDKRLVLPTKRGETYRIGYDPQRGLYRK